MNKTCQDVFSICLIPQKQVLTDRLAQCALFHLEMEILNNSETYSLHALVSIENIYILSRFGKYNV